MLQSQRFRRGRCLVLPAMLAVLPDSLVRARATPAPRISGTVYRRSTRNALIADQIEVCQLPRPAVSVSSPWLECTAHRGRRSSRAAMLRPRLLWCPQDRRRTRTSSAGCGRISSTARSHTPCSALPQSPLDFPLHRLNVLTAGSPRADCKDKHAYVYRTCIGRLRAGPAWLTDAIRLVRARPQARCTLGTFRLHGGGRVAELTELAKQHAMVFEFSLLADHAGRSIHIWLHS
jgi:hypothetical protein